MFTRFVFALAAWCFLAWQGVAQPTASHVSTFNWSVEDPNFGGLSGLELSDDGTSFTAVTDRGRFVTGKIERVGGNITAVTGVALSPMQSANSPRLNSGAADSEGLAIAPDGEVFVGFEIYQRVWRYQSIHSRAARLPRHPDFGILTPNGALEAVAVSPDGTIYTLPENPGRNVWPTPVYRYQYGHWDVAFLMPRKGRFRAVGADFGPDGALYILERAFSPLGFRSRVRRLDITPRGIARDEQVFESNYRDYDNLEGLAVWRDADQNIRLTMVSDDNFMFFQTTQFVEYVIK